MALVEVEDLRKHYGDVKAVDGVSFSVGEGEVFGLVGPNGAGKTTTLEMIEGLRHPDGGRVQVAGLDAVRDARRVKEVIGVQLQATALFEKLTVRETLRLFGAFYAKRHSAETLLKLVFLEEKADALTETLSGGQKQRLSVALALVNDPQLVFLDEPTTGLDPQARRGLWDVIRELKGIGKTLILTTHYMEEAEQLCERVGIMDHGKVIALDTPAELVRSLGSRRAIEFRATNVDVNRLRAVTAVDDVRQENGTVILYSRDVEGTLSDLFDVTRRNGMQVADLHIRNPSLEDVFLALTGRRIRE